MNASAELPLELIVGLGNPGPEYAATRHNAGAWFVERLASSLGGAFKAEKKFFGRLANVQMAGQGLRLLLPDTWMNESGKSVAALANFYRLAPETILVAHDEIDLPCGTIRFKQSGGLAGHNGLRSISSSLAGARSFNRLRIGVGHPGDKSVVMGHVLGKVSAAEKASIDACIDDALAALPKAVAGDWQLAMRHLHNRTGHNRTGHNRTGHNRTGHTEADRNKAAPPKTQEKTDTGGN